MYLLTVQYAEAQDTQGLVTKKRLPFKGSVECTGLLLILESLRLSQQDGLSKMTPELEIQWNGEPLHSGWRTGGRVPTHRF